MSAFDDLTRAIAAAAERVAPTKGVFSLAEVAEITGWNAEAIRRACKNGTYEHIKAGKHYGMALPHVVAMVAKHTVPAKDTAPVAATPIGSGPAAGIEAVLAAGASRFRQKGRAAA